MTIGELSKRTGIGVEAIRFYQRLGLVEVPERNSAWRQYTEASIARILFIKKAQRHGLTLKEIRVLLSDLTKFTTGDRLQDFARKKLIAVKKEVRRLNQVSKSLSAVLTSAHNCSGADCCLQSLLGDLKANNETETVRVSGS